MAKEIIGYIKLQVPAAQLTRPPIGPALSRRGLNIMELLRNSSTQDARLGKGIPIPVIITAFSGPQLHVCHEAAEYVLHQKSRQNRKRLKDAWYGDGRQDHDGAGCVRSPREKMADLNANDLDTAYQMIHRFRPLDGRSGCE